jgi:putative ABC transport system ATP-binding protein
MTMKKIALRAQALTKVFGEGDVRVEAVRGIDLVVKHGEVVLIMGPSGSGKTTLLSMLGAMLRPTSGHVFIDGSDIATMPERDLPDVRARRFGFVFQDFNLLGALSALENVEFALNLSGVTGRTARERATDILTRFGLDERLHFRPEKLSGGEKQRVAIARALVNEPSVILADEPTANLDSKIGHEIARLLRHAATEQGRSVVLVSHDERLKDIADRILWLEDGAFRAVDEMAVDPVCGMSVSREGTAHFQLDGQTYFFCSAPCRKEFGHDPGAFVAIGRRSRSPAPALARGSAPKNGRSTSTRRKSRTRP